MRNVPNRPKIGPAVFAAALLAASSIQAGTLSWTGAGTGSATDQFLSATNWDSGTVPGAADDLIIGDNTARTPVTPATVQYDSTLGGATATTTVNSLTIKPSESLTIVTGNIGKI